ncbi:endonuclease III [Myxococcota bacterium]|nr:endonuclease III [Myxococcota bacterium]
MQRAEKARRIQVILDERHPSSPVPLDHEDPFTLLIAVLLSAQTTDKKVNEVTPALFALGRTPQAMAALDEARILACIRTLGLAPTKARNVRALAQRLVDEHGGAVPADMAALEALPGVGHKTASVVMAQAFGVPAFPVDTHIHRLAWRWGLSDGSSVERTERDLKALFPRERWNDLHLQIIWFGRESCPARGHDPAACPICSWAGVRRRLEAERRHPRVEDAMRATRAR